MELTDNKDLLQTVFDSASNGIAVMRSVYNKQGRVEDFSILLFNDYTRNWIGDTDYKGKRYGDVFPTVKETGILDKFIEVAETGVTARFESWYAGEGMKHWFRFTAVKQAELLVVTTEDITETKQAEIVLNNTLDLAEKQKRLYDSIINNTPDLVYVLDRNYNFTYANKALLTMWGKTAEEAIGKGLRQNGYEEWHAQMHEREIDEVVAMKKSIRGTVSFPHAELGKRVYDYIFVPVLNDNGEVEAIAGTTRDITELKRTEEKLQQSEIRLKTMIDQTPAPTLLLMGDDLVVEQINKHMLQMIGRSEEIIGLPLIEVLPELKGQYVWKQVQKVYKEGIAFDQREILVSHNRTAVKRDYYYNVAYRPLTEDGIITGMIQVAIDVTDQVMARKKLEESESRFRALVNASSDVVYSMNADWTIMRHLEGRGFLADTGEPIPDWVEKYIHPEDRDKVMKTVADAIAKKRVFEMEHRVLNADGATGWTFSRATPIMDDRNNIIEWFGAASDVTEPRMIEQSLRQSESRFRNVINSTPVGTAILTGPEMKVEVANDVIIKYWRRDNSVIGKPLTEAIPELIGQPFPELLNTVYTTGATHIDNGALAYFLNDEGELTPAYFNYSYTALRETNGNIYGVLIMAIDVTNEFTSKILLEESESRYRALSKSLEQQVNERTKELQRSNEDLQQFAHVASHDLREPVRKIKTFTARLEDQLAGKLDETGAKYIKRIHVATNRMFTMIDGVLAYSTINASTQKPEPVDLNEMIRNIETDLEVSLQERGGIIRYDDLPVMNGAPVLLYQLFYNLINNSIKFSKPGEPPIITISSEITEDQNESYVRITLNDNGIGFEPEYAAQIFDTFTRLNPKDKYEGTGLGLSLCKKIVERHGGKIFANGIPGIGATFILTLPLEQKEKGI